MKFLILLIAALGATAAFEFDSYEQNYADIVPTLLGGQDSQWGQFPSAVFLDGPNDFCGGTIIDPSHVLTAASCVLNSRYEIINPIYWRVVAGDIFFSQPSARRVTLGVSRIFVHSDFSPFTGVNNLAILRLNRPVPLPHNTIEVARRRTRIARNGLQCQLVAFGRNSNATTVAMRARQILLGQSIMDRLACGNVFPHANRVEDTMICTETSNTSAPCSGSLGSGLYCEGFLTGVLSGGNNCNATPALYQQVRAFNRWIDDQIRAPLNVEQAVSPLNMRGFPRPLA